MTRFVGFRIHREVTPPQPKMGWEFWVWHWTVSDREAIVIEYWGVRNSDSLPLFPDPVWPIVLALVCVICMGQIDLSKAYLYFIEIVNTI